MEIDNSHTKGQGTAHSRHLKEEQAATPVLDMKKLKVQFMVEKDA